MLSAIWAQAKNGVIGTTSGKIPWKLHADMHHFVQMTKGHTIIAGRKTFDTFPKNGLPHRTNMVLTSHSKDDFPDSVIVFHSVKSFLKYEKLHPEEEIMIVGGSKIYQLLLPYTSNLYETVVDHNCKGEISFPHVDYSKFKLTSSKKHPADSRNEYPFVFKNYKRISI